MQPSRRGGDSDGIGNGSLRPGGTDQLGGCGGRCNLGIGGPPAILDHLHRVLMIATRVICVERHENGSGIRQEMAVMASSKWQCRMPSPQPSRGHGQSRHLALPRRRIRDAVVEVFALTAHPTPTVRAKSMLSSGSTTTLIWPGPGEAGPIASAAETAAPAVENGRSQLPVNEICRCQPVPARTTGSSPDRYARLASGADIRTTATSIPRHTPPTVGQCATSKEPGQPPQA